MSDSIFAGLFLRSVDQALRPNPTVDDCLNLFKIFKPDITLPSLRSVSRRSSIWKEIKLRTHPDKHPGLKTEAEAVFKKLDGFILKCENMDFHYGSKVDSGATVEKPLKRPKLSKFPDKFHVEQKWAGALKDKSYLWNKSKTSYDVCENIRGQIIHYGFTRRNIGIIRIGGSSFKALTYPETNVIDIDAIKEEISNNGPVVSRSYLPHIGTCQENEYPVIIGWDTLPVQGEVWLVRTQKSGDQEFSVAFSTLSIEKDIAIPTSDTKNEEWQSGVYLPVSGEEWKSWSSLCKTMKIADFFVLAAQLLIVELLSQRLLNGSVKKKYIEVHSEGCKAYSRKSYLVDFEYFSDTTVKVHINFET